MISDSTIDLIKDTDLLLDIPAEVQDKCRQASRNFSSSSKFAIAYSNLLVKQVFLSYLLEENIQAQSQDCEASFWEFGINGTRIMLENKDLLLIPSDVIDTEEFRVCQEWIDIPSLTADYYLAVQIDMEENYLRFWGYTTHKEFKEKGYYTDRNRTYYLDGDDLIEDLNVLWVSYQFCPDESTKKTLEVIPKITQQQADNLLLQLGNPKQPFIRRKLPFSQWAALIENEQWRDKLYKLHQQKPTILTVTQWLKQGISEVGKQLKWKQLQMQSDLVYAMGKEDKTELIIFSRQLIIAGQPYELRIQSENNSEDNYWQFSLHSLAVGGLIPAGFKLRLLTQDFEPFEDNEEVATTATEQLTMNLELESGEGLVWEIEPIPDDYQREILQF